MFNLMNQELSIQTFATQLADVPLCVQSFTHAKKYYSLYDMETNLNDTQRGDSSNHKHYTIEGLVLHHYLQKYLEKIYASFDIHPEAFHAETVLVPIFMYTNPSSFDALVTIWTQSIPSWLMISICPRVMLIWLSVFTLNQRVYGFSSFFLSLVSYSICLSGWGNLLLLRSTLHLSHRLFDYNPLWNHTFPSVWSGGSRWSLVSTIQFFTPIQTTTPLHRFLTFSPSFNPIPPLASNILVRCSPFTKLRD